MPTTVDLTAVQVTDAAAALLNDAAKTTYTFAVLLPYLNIALNELQELFQANDIPVTQNTTSAAIEMDAGVTEVGFSPSVPVPGDPYLPDDLIEILLVWQRFRGIDPWYPLSKTSVTPQNLRGAPTNLFLSYVWESNTLIFLPSTSDLDIRLDYVRRLFVPLTGEQDNINVINVETFLGFRTASLAAKFIMQDDTRAQGLDTDAGAALDRSLGIPTKGRQNMLVRRRPFRAGYKARKFG